MVIHQRYKCMRIRWKRGRKWTYEATMLLLWNRSIISKVFEKCIFFGWSIALALLFMSRYGYFFCKYLDFFRIACSHVTSKHTRTRRSLTELTTRASIGKTFTSSYPFHKKRNGEKRKGENRRILPWPGKRYRPLWLIMIVQIWRKLILRSLTMKESRKRKD